MKGKGHHVQQKIMGKIVQYHMHGGPNEEKSAVREVGFNFYPIYNLVCMTERLYGGSSSFVVSNATQHTKSYKIPIFERVQQKARHGSCLRSEEGHHCQASC